MKEFYGHRKNAAASFFAGMILATIVGGYFLFVSKKARKNRQKVEWMIEDARDEIYSKIKKIKNLSEEKIDEIVDSVMEKYQEMRYMKGEVIDKLKKEIKRKWEEAKNEYDEGDFED